MACLGIALTAGLRGQAPFVYWNPAGSGALQGGSGTWDLTSNNWTADGQTYVSYTQVGVGGGSAYADVPVLFGSGTVQVTAAIAAAGIDFASGPYTLTVGTGGSLSLMADAVNFPAILRSNGAGVTNTINGSLTNSSTQAISIDGPGTLQLNGSLNTNGYGLNILGGTLSLSSAKGSIDTGAYLTFGSNVESPLGGSSTFILDNTGATGATTQTLGGVTVVAGAVTIESKQVAGQSQTLALGSMTGGRSAGSTLNLVTVGGTNGVDNKITMSGTYTGAASGYLDFGTYYNGSNFAYLDSSGYVRGVNWGVDSGSATSAGGTSLAAKTYQQITGNVTAQTTATFTGLNLSGAVNLTVATSNIVTVNGILKSGGGASTLSGGTIKPSGAQLIVRTDQATDSLTISSVIANGSSATTLTKSGAGTLTVSGTNTYTGSTYLNEGSFSVTTLPSTAGASAIGTKQTVILGGGTLDYTGVTATTTANLQLLIGGGGINVDSASANLTLSKSITGANTQQLGDALVKGGPGTLTLAHSNNGLDLVVNAGKAVLADTSTGTQAVNDLQINSGGTVQIAGSNSDQIIDTGLTVINSGGTLDMNGKKETIGSLTGAGSITNTSATASTLTIGGDNGESKFTGTVANGTGTVAIVKTGTGTSTLGGADTYTGGTKVNGGTLVAGSASAFGTGAITVTPSGFSSSALNLGGNALSNSVTVGSGGTLQGPGSVGALTVSGGTVAPGDAPGVISAASASFTGGSAIHWEINNAAGAAGTGYDELQVTGLLRSTATSGSPLTIDVTSLTLANTAGNAANFNPNQSYTFTLATAGSISGFGAGTVVIDTSGFTNGGSGTWALVQSGNTLELTYSAVPEPATYGLIAGIASLAAAVVMRRRRELEA